MEVTTLPSVYAALVFVNLELTQLDVKGFEKQRCPEKETRDDTNLTASYHRRNMIRKGRFGYGMA